MEKTIEATVEATIEAMEKAFAEESRREAYEKYSDKADEIMQLMDDEDIYLASPEKFSYYISDEYDKFTSVLLQKAAYTAESENREKLEFVYKQYNFIMSHIRELVVSRCGYNASVAVAWTVIKEYISDLKYEYSDTQKWQEDYYAYPKFGTSEEWFQLCDALYSLYYGNPTEYLKIYGVLLTSTIRKFKHVKATWYVKLANGIKFQVGATIDDDVFTFVAGNEEDVKLIPKKYVTEEVIPYVKTLSDDYDIFQQRAFYAINKNDIKSISAEYSEIYL